MPSEYKPLATKYLSSANVLIRLTKKDTLFLLRQLQDAVDRHTGVSFVYVGMTNAISLTHSDEQGRQIKCIAYNRGGAVVKSHMKGYTGPWSHIEMAMPLTSLKGIRQFMDEVESEQLQLI